MGHVFRRHATRRTRNRQLQTEINEQLASTYDDIVVPASTVGPGWWLIEDNSDGQQIDGQDSDEYSSIVVEPRC